MSVQPKLRPQAMTAKDLEFDALLSRAAECSRRDAIEMARETEVPRKEERGAKDLQFAVYAAKGQ